MARHYCVEAWGGPQAYWPGARVYAHAFSWRDARRVRRGLARDGYTERVSIYPTTWQNPRWNRIITKAGLRALGRA